MTIKLNAAQQTDVGKEREQNEDAAYNYIVSATQGDLGLFIVADGMGGYEAGEIASRIAIETVSKTFSKTLTSFVTPIYDQPTLRLNPAMANQQVSVVEKQKTHQLPETPLASFIDDQLIDAVRKANEEIMRYGEEHPSSRGLGCTITLAFVYNDQAYIANVGDSRTYLLRANNLIAITRDHSLVAKLVEEKQITEEEVYTHPQRNLIFRSLGAGHKDVEVDIFHETLYSGDMLLLCTDGLWEMVHKQDLLNLICSEFNTEDICNRLIDKANENGGEDNITAIVVHIDENDTEIQFENEEII